MKRILIVEDEPNIADIIKRELVADGYSVVVVGDGESALEQATARRFDLILLDLMLPRKDGYSVCRELRAKKCSIPILMLTAKGSETERVVGLDSGADDYVVKPFGKLELMARVRALLRRAVSDEPHIFTFGNVEVDFDRAEARKDGKPVALTKTEYELLVCFIRSRRRILTRDWLLDQVWRDKESVDRVIDMHVMHLREKLEQDPRTPVYFVSVRGLGYRFEA